MRIASKRQVDLIKWLPVSSKQALSLKFARGSWSARELVIIAEACGCQLAFVFPDGKKVNINND